MPEPGSVTIETGAIIPELLSPQLGNLGLNEDLARRAFRELPQGGNEGFKLLESFGLDKTGASPESTLAATAVIRLAKDKMAGLINADDTILPENKPATVRVNLKHLFQPEPNETPQQRFIKILEFVLGNEG